MTHKKRVPKTVYRIEIEGELGETWSDWFNGMSLSVAGDPPVTTLTGPVPDQAALRGLLNKIWDLNLVLVSVCTLGDREIPIKR